MTQNFSKEIKQIKGLEESIAQDLNHMHHNDRSYYMQDCHLQDIMVKPAEGLAAYIIRSDGMAVNSITNDRTNWDNHMLINIYSNKYQHHKIERTVFHHLDGSLDVYPDSQFEKIIDMERKNNNVYVTVKIANNTQRTVVFTVR